MESAVLAAIPAIILAMSGVLKLVLNALDRVEARQEKFLGNHLSSNTAALQNLTAAIQNHAAKSELELLRMRVALRHAGVEVPEAEVGGDE